MTSKKISEFPTALSLTGAEFSAIQDGRNVRIPASFLENDEKVVFETRSDVVNANISADVNYIITTGYSTVGDNGGGSYVRAASEPAHEGKIQSDDDTWWELAETEPTIEMFGGKADAVVTGSNWNKPTAVTSGTDNLQPFYDMVEYLREKSVGTVPIAPCKFGTSGTYYFSSHVNVKLTLHIKSLVNGGTAGPTSQRCVFPQGSSGFIFHRGDTIDFGRESPTTGAASGSIWEGPHVACCGTPVLDTQSYGLQLRSRCELIRPRVTNFAQNIRIVATSGSADDALQGNANGWRIWSGRVEDGVYGLYVDGADANAGAAFGLDANSNLIAGVYDDSFLGNDYFGVFTDGNSSGTYLVQVHNLGATYMCVDPVLAPTTEPTVATSYPNVPWDANPVWMYKAAAASPSETAPQWVSGTQTFYRGGSVVLLGNSSNSVRHGGYDESNQSYGYIEFGNKCTGGQTNHMGNGAVWTNTSMTGMAFIEAETFKTHDSSALTESIRLNNRASGNNRYQRICFSNNFLTDGYTQKVMSTIDGGKDANGNPSLLVRTNTGADDNLYDLALEVSGGTVKRVMPGTDLIWSLGIATKRWLNAFFGNISLFPAASVTPTVNGEVTFQLTSNTELTFKVKGSDGTVRSGSVTLV